METWETLSDYGYEEIQISLGCILQLWSWRPWWSIFRAIQNDRKLGDSD